MPYVIMEMDGQFCVHKEADNGGPDGEALKCHASRSEAEQQVRALYADEGTGKAAVRVREWKAVPSYTQSIEDRTVTGFASVFGNPDDGDDIVHKGAFNKTIQESAKRVRHLWQHAVHEPPTALVKQLREVGREELPADLLRDYPEATGGLVVTREYLTTPRGEEALAGIKAGAIAEMSFGYETLVKDFTKRGSKTFRNLRELRLYETSDVNWGMNPATRAAKSEDEVDTWAAYVLEQIAGLKAGLSPVFQFKEGRVISTLNLGKLKSAIDALQQVLASAEPPAPAVAMAPTDAVKSLFMRLELASREGVASWI
jgi:HK97 family phage prohead protease